MKSASLRQFFTTQPWVVAIVLLVTQACDASPPSTMSPTTADANLSTTSFTYPGFPITFYRVVGTCNYTFGLTANGPGPWATGISSSQLSSSTSVSASTTQSVSPGTSIGWSDGVSLPWVANTTYTCTATLDAYTFSGSWPAVATDSDQLTTGFSPP